jgi:hypothetical protein
MATDKWSGEAWIEEAVGLDLSVAGVMWVVKTQVRYCVEVDGR